MSVFQYLKDGWNVMTLPIFWIVSLVRWFFYTGQVFGPLTLAYFIYQTPWMLDSIFFDDPDGWFITSWFYVEKREKMITSIRTWAVLAFLVYNLAAFALGFPWSAWFKRERKFVEDFEGFRPEKVFPNSPLTTGVKPRFQADVLGWCEETRKWVASGQGFLYEDLFITANHVISGYERVKLRTKNGTFECPSERFENIEGDVAIGRVGGDVLANLGLKSCKLVNSTPTEYNGLFCQSTGFTQTSMGLVKPHLSFGFVSYTGSTVGGFSGSAYYCANQVYGMHLGGCTENMGYSSSYLLMLINSVREYDTPKWILDQIMKFGEFAYQRSPFNPDEYRVRVRGQYYLVDDEDLRSFLGSGAKASYIDRFSVDYEPESLPKTKAKKPKTVRYEPESLPCPELPPARVLKEAEYLNPVGTTSVIPPPEGFLVDTAQKDSFLGKGAPATQVPGPTKVQLAVPKPKRSPRAGISLLSPPKSSDGLQQIRAQREEVLQGISKFSRKLKMTTPLLTPALSNKRLMKSNPESLSTQLTSLRQEIEKALSAIGSITESLISTTEAQQV